MWHTRFTDPQVRAERLERLREDLGRKRHIKWSRRSASRLAARLLPTDLETIPIHVRDAGPFVHYPASVADIRAVMRRLPKGMLDGLKAVELCLGREDQNAIPDAWYNESDAPDPWVGRRGDALWPGVYHGRVGGVYMADSARIRLYAYVYESGLPDRTIKELTLRLQMLSAFVHEVAHHFDFTLRVARGRWRADDTEKLEAFAEREEATYALKNVVPYLEQAYPEEVRAFSAWTEHHGGTPIALSMLAGDTGGAPTKDGMVPLRFTTTGAFNHLVEDVSHGHDLVTTRLHFARELHYCERYVEALSILDRVLAEHPEHLEALTLQADIAEHQEEYDRAESICRKVLAMDAASVDAWDVMVEIYQARRDWVRLLDAATRAMRLGDPSTGHWLRLMEKCARARLHLADYTGLAEDAKAFAEAKWHGWKRCAAALRAMRLLRTGRCEEALRFAAATLASTPGVRYARYDYEISAVQFEAAHRLGRAGEAGGLSAHDIECLRWMGHEAWIDRLEAEFGLRPTPVTRGRARRPPGRTTPV